MRSNMWINIIYKENKLEELDIIVLSVL